MVSRGQQLVLALLLLSVAFCQTKDADDDDEDNGDWANAIRLLVDLFNIGAFIAEQCTDESAGPNACLHWMAGLGLLILILSIGCAIANSLGIDVSQDPKYKKRRTMAMDTVRVAGLGANLQKLQSWWG